jgi:hypothetical protein
LTALHTWCLPQVNKEALRAQSNGTYSTGERLIPEEAM